MQYAKVVTPVREAFIALELPTLGRAVPCQQLFDQADVSGWEVWLAYSHNNFSNPFQQADEKRYQKRGWWAEILRDTVRNGGKGTDDKGRLHVKYTSRADTEWEQEDLIWAPKSGWYVPTKDGIFVPGKLVPFETIENKKKAMKRLEANGIPAEQLSYFYRLDDYGDGYRFVGRSFYPDLDDDGRFHVYADWAPSDLGNGRVSSRPAYGHTEIVMEAGEAQREAKAK